MEGCRAEGTCLRGARRDLLHAAVVVAQQRGANAWRVVEAAGVDLGQQRLLNQFFQAALRQHDLGGNHRLRCRKTKVENDNKAQRCQLLAGTH